MGLHFKGFSLSGISNVLNAINQVAPPETAAVVSVIPGGVGSDIKGDIELAEVSLSLLTGLFQALAQAHSNPATPINSVTAVAAAQ